MITGKPLAYSTYVVGAHAFYDPRMLDDVRKNIPSFFAPIYFSTWRILHIDGFEPMYPRLPARTGYKIEFFTVPRAPKSQQYCGGE